MAGQTIHDRLLAARHSLTCQSVSKSVCKATTEEMIAPKNKHLDYLVQCTNEPNVSIPHLANLLIERSQNANWVVMYKALITVHHLMAFGNERFIQYLASNNSTFNLNNLLDPGTAEAKICYDMSPFIRRYAKYLNKKAFSYRTVAIDFCKAKRGKENGLRTINADKLLKTLPVLQAQLDALLEFDCTANDLTNGVINKCFMLLFRDLIRLFACYNDGIINLLEKYFDMNKKQCRNALDIYKKFLVRMDRVEYFLKVGENSGIDKGGIPDLTKAPSSLLDALEQHLASIEGQRGSVVNTPTQTASNQHNIKNGVSTLSSTSFSFGTITASTRFDTIANGINDEIKAQALAEEEAAMSKYKNKILSPTNSGALTNPFLSSPSQPPSATQASVDLLQLENPFYDIFEIVPAQSAAPTNKFISELNFSTVFENPESMAFDALGDYLKPGPTDSQKRINKINTDTAADQTGKLSDTPPTPGKILTCDLDSSLASLAENLTINKRVSTQVKSEHWNLVKNASKLRSAGWTPQPMATTTGADYRPMAQGRPVTPAPSTIHPFPVLTTYVQQGIPVKSMPINIQQQQQPVLLSQAAQPNQNNSNVQFINPFEKPF